MQTLDTGCGFSDVSFSHELCPGQLSIHQGPLPAQRRGSHKALHMLVLSFRRLPGCRGQAKRGAGHKHSCSPVFKRGEQSGQYAGLMPAHHVCWRKRNGTSPKSASGQGQPCSLALWPTLGRRMELSLRARNFSHQREGAGGKNCPHPAPEPGSQALTVSASFSLLSVTPEGAPFPAAETRKTPASQTAQKSVNLSQSKHKGEPGVTRGKKKKRLCALRLVHSLEITSLSTPVCTVSHSIRASLFTEMQSTLQEMGEILQGARLWTLGKEGRLSVSP